MKLSKSGILLSLLAASIGLNAAGLPQWEIIPDQSTLSFTATQNDSPITGQFKKFSGEILVDPKQYQSSSIHIIVDMNSLSASYGELVTTLTTPEWFNIKAFPTADFKATQFKQKEDKSYEANGTLTIRDKSAAVILSFSAEETTPGKAHVKGTTTIKRSAFGVGQGEWSSTDEVKDEVVVNFEINAKRKP